MGTNEVLNFDALDVDDNSPTEPEIRMSSLPRVDNPEDDLEKRLAWLAEELRASSAEQAKKKRQESVLEAREYKTATVPTATQVPNDIDLPKVTLAVGVVPQRDPTLVGRRTNENEWDFDVSDPEEELSRTLPLDPQASLADPLPFHAPTAERGRPSHRTFLMMLAMLGGVFLGGFLYASFSRSHGDVAHANIPRRNQGIGQVAQAANTLRRDAETRRHDWEEVQRAAELAIAPPQASADAPAASPSASARPRRPTPSPSSTNFPWLQPNPSTPRGPATSSAPTLIQNKPRSPLYDMP